jgi:RHS repeat-associated protein
VAYDANWNVTAIMVNSNSGASIQERYTYDPYGAVTILAPNGTVRSSSSYDWKYLHQTGRLDGDTGLYHLSNRDYSATLGRWTQTDPIGFDAGDTNLYRYVGNGPVNGVDPSGLREKDFGMSRRHDGTIKLKEVKEPGPLSNYWHYFFNSGEMDSDLYNAQLASDVVAIGCGGGLLVKGGISVAPRIGGYIMPRIVGSFGPGSRIGAGVGAGVAGSKGNKPFDPFLGGGSNAGFGKIIEWGTGAIDASNRMKCITTDQLRKIGMTREVAEHWLRFYSDAVAKGRGADTASARIDLMKRILELLE